MTSVFDPSQPGRAARGRAHATVSRARQEPLRREPLRRSPAHRTPLRRDPVPQEPLRRDRPTSRPLTRIGANEGIAPGRGTTLLSRARSFASQPAATASGRGTWTHEAIGLLAICGLLTTIGLTFILSASSVFSLGSTDSVWTIFLRQLRWEGVGLVVCVAAALGSRLLRSAWFAMWVATVVALLLVQTPLGVSRNGSTRWIGPRSLEIQPSELAKLAVVVALARMLSLNHDYRDPRTAAKYLAPFAVLPIVLVAMQPDLGTTIVLSSAALSVLYGAQIRARFLAAITAAGLFFVGVSLALNPYQYERLAAFLDPTSEEAYHTRRSIAGIGAGGWRGVGIGASRSKWGFLPNAHTDFIFSVIVEEVGLVGGSLVVALYAAFALLGIRIANRAPDRFSRLVAFGIVGWITAQVFANIATVTGLAPVTGVPLPFISQGGTAFVSLMAAVGVLLDIARRGRTATDRAAGAKGSRVRFTGRP